MTGMLAHLAATGSTRRVISVHADRSQATHAFRTDLEQLTRKLDNACAHVFYERPDSDWPRDRTRLADLSGIVIAAEAAAYLCPSCARSAPSCWSAVSGPPTSTTKSSAPTSGWPDACRRPRYSAIGR
jgi:hypothetical protein